MPGPHGMQLLGRRGTAVAFARDPLKHVLLAAQRYGTFSALSQDEPGIVVAPSLEMNRFLQATAEHWHRPPAFFCDEDTTNKVLLPLYAGLVDRRQGGNGLRAALLTDDAIARHYHIALQRTLGTMEQWHSGWPIDVRYVMRELALTIGLDFLWGDEVPAHAERLVIRLRHVANLCASVSIPALLQAGWTSRYTRTEQLGRELLAMVQRTLHEQQSQRETGGDRERAMVGDASGEQPGDGHAMDGGASDEQQANMHAQDVLRLLVTVPLGCGAVLGWAFFLLGQHPAILAELQGQLRGRLVGRLPGADELDEVPLLRWVVLETLRLFPPISAGSCTCSTALEFGQYQLPAGTTVVYSPYVTHRMAELFLHPQRFRPQRWRFIEPETYGFVPFGVFGSGGWEEQYVMRTAMLVLATVVQRYNLSLAPDVPIERWNGMPLTAKQGIPMMISPADRPLTRRIAQGTVGEMVLLDKE
ncbi:MAG: hypothetical protein NVS2B7_06410 [Herpetosiphon sp.]